MEIVLVTEAMRRVFCFVRNIINDLSNKEKVTVMYELSEAMKEVHIHGMIHRDLKPENNLLDSSKHVKLTDFGVSCIVDVTSQTQSKTAGLGPLKFMAPELLQESTHYILRCCCILHPDR